MSTWTRLERAKRAMPNATLRQAVEAGYLTRADVDVIVKFASTPRPAARPKPTSGGGLFILGLLTGHFL